MHAVLAFGTDAPAERIEPLYSLHAATTPRDPARESSDGWCLRQCLGLDEAVRAYTWGSAAAERSAAWRGSVTAGMDADLVSLAPDPFGQPAEALLSTRVMLTMVGGRITHEGE
jgi:predicted amidohydrolase YtcJ